MTDVMDRDYFCLCFFSFLGFGAMVFWKNDFGLSAWVRLTSEGPKFLV
jgi:hypothetical protein